MKIVLQLYGPLKQYGPRVELELLDPTVRMAKLALAELLLTRGLKDPTLVERSALGDDERVFKEDEALTASVYAVLPPVAGG